MTKRRKKRKSKKGQILYLDQYISKKYKQLLLHVRLQQSDADIIADALDLPGVMGNRSAAVRLILRQWNEHLNPKRKDGDYE